MVTEFQDGTVPAMFADLGSLLVTVATIITAVAAGIAWSNRKLTARITAAVSAAMQPTREALAVEHDRVDDLNLRLTAIERDLASLRAAIDRVYDLLLQRKDTP